MEDTEESGTSTGLGAGLGVFLLQGKADDSTIGRTVRALREAKGLSQAELAGAIEKAGISGFYPQTILRIEKGQRGLKFVEALAIASILDVPTDRLAGSVPSPDDIRARSLSMHLISQANDHARLVARVADLRPRLEALFDEHGDELLPEVRGKVLEALERSTSLALGAEVRRYLGARTEAASGEHPEAP